MSTRQGIVPGAVVEITDWPWKKGLEKPYLVVRKFKRGGKLLARILPAVKDKKHYRGGFTWTVADLKRIGFQAVPPSSVPLVLSGMDWTVMIETVVEMDGEDSYCSWHAWAQEYTNGGWGHFRHEVKQVDDSLERTRTPFACLLNWKKFAAANGWSKYAVRYAGLSSAGELPFWARLKDCSDLYHTQRCLAHNDLVRLDSWLNFSAGIYGGDLISLAEKKKRIRKMKKDGEWRRYQLVKRMFLKDPYLVRYYDNFPSETGIHSDNLAVVKEAKKRDGIKWTVTRRQK